MTMNDTGCTKHRQSDGGSGVGGNGNGGSSSSSSSSGGGGDGFFLECYDLGRMFDNSFPACASFLSGN